MVAILIILASLLAALGALILYIGGSMGTNSIPALILSLGIIGLAGVLAMFARIAQAAKQHPTVRPIKE